MSILFQKSMSRCCILLCAACVLLLCCKLEGVVTRGQQQAKCLGCSRWMRGWIQWSDFTTTTPSIPLCLSFRRQWGHNVTSKGKRMGSKQQQKKIAGWAAAEVVWSCVNCESQNATQKGRRKMGFCVCMCVLEGESIFLLRGHSSHCQWQQTSWKDMGAGKGKEMKKIRREQ